MEKRYYRRADISNRDFTGENLAGAHFEECTMNGVSFKDAVLDGAVFNKCFGRGVFFSGASMRQVRMDNCEFKSAYMEHTDLFDSQLTSVDLFSSVMTGCRFNKSKIDNLNIGGCELSMVSFLDTQLFSVSYLPTIDNRMMRGMSLLKPGKLHHNPVFLNGNQHLQFFDYCRREAVKERLFTSVDMESRWWLRIPKVAALWLFGMISDFGQSFTRWFFFLVGTVAFFALVFFKFLSLTFVEALNVSVRAFFSLDITGITQASSPLFLLESIIGYFMLGVLVSMLTYKIIQS